MPKYIRILLSDLKGMLNGDQQIIKMLNEMYGDAKEFDYPRKRKEEIFLTAKQCPLCERILKGEHGLAIHMRAHKK